MRRWSIGIGAVVVLVLACVIYAADVSNSVGTSLTDENKPTKVYMIYTVGGFGTQGFIIRSLERVDFQGIPCLQGTGGGESSGYLKSKIIYIPVDNIAYIVEFDSLKELEESRKQYDIAMDKLR